MILRTEIDRGEVHTDLGRPETEVRCVTAAQLTIRVLAEALDPSRGNYDAGVSEGVRKRRRVVQNILVSAQTHGHERRTHFARTVTDIVRVAVKADAIVTQTPAVRAVRHAYASGVRATVEGQDRSGGKTDRRE